VTATGHTPSYAVDSVEPLRAPAAVARQLLIGRGRTVVRLVRRGFVDGEVASHQTMWLAAGLVPGIAELVADGGSVADLLVETFGMRPDRWWSTAELLPPPADIAAQLELTGRPPAWRTETVNRCLERAVPIELAQGWMRADCFRVSLELGPVDGRPPRAEGGT